MHVLIVIPARGGSKGLPGKNLRCVGGVSLVGRAVYAARGFARLAGIDATIFVDTDSAEIAEEGRRYGADVPFLRPAELAGDATSTSDSVLHAVQRLIARGVQVDVIVLLQPTSPLRTAEDIAACWKEFDRASAPSVISTVPVGHPPELSLRAGADGVLDWALGEPPHDIRRQAFRPATFPSGAVYVLTHELLRREGRFIVPGVTRSVLLPPAHSVDIDTADDLALAEALANAAPFRSFALGGLWLERGRCPIIADAGIRHHGDVAESHRLIDAAADAGADAIKFSTLDLAHSSLGSLREIKARAADRGLVLLLSASGERGADVVEELGLSAFCISPTEKLSPRLLAHVARKGRPLVLWTGTATMPDIADAVLTIRGESTVPFALFRGAKYATLPQECNLGAMSSMRALFGVPVGWSDSTVGVDISLAAAALGADMIERQFTLDGAPFGSDHKTALDPAELAALVASIRVTGAAARASSVGDVGHGNDPRA